MRYTEDVIRHVLRLKDKKVSHRDISMEVFGKTTAASSVCQILQKHHPDYVNKVKAVSRVSRVKSYKKPIRIMMIPDAQVKKGVPMNHLNALGNYIVDKKPDVLLNIGDFADMPSLSVYDKAGSKKTEGSRYKDDIQAAKDAMDILMGPIFKYNETCKKGEEYNPRMIMTLGNHEHRITRAIEENPRHFEGVIGLEDLEYENYGWEVYPFLEMVEVGGVFFSHYFINPNSLTKNTIGGTMDTKLKNLGFSFAMGHQQIFQNGHLYRTNGDHTQGLVAGAFYQHNEDYMGHQGNKSHWRGAVCMNEVEDGKYDIMPLSMRYLLNNWDF